MTDFIKGKAYNVRHHNSKKTVRRIFKGTEQRFGEILCFVFTGKVSKMVTVEVEQSGHATFFRWKGIKHVPNEISIPYYNLTKADLIS